jgi:hypothetical protein
MELSIYSVMIYKLNHHEFAGFFPSAIFNDLISSDKYSHFYLEGYNIEEVSLTCQKLGICILESTLIS